MYTHTKVSPNPFPAPTIEAWPSCHGVWLLPRCPIEADTAGYNWQ